MVIKSLQVKLADAKKVYKDKYDCIPMTAILLIIIVLVAIMSGMGIKFIIELAKPIFFIWGIAIAVSIVTDSI